MTATPPAKEARRDLAESIIRGVERDQWNPTPAMKRAVADIMRDYLAGASRSAALEAALRDLIVAASEEDPEQGWSTSFVAAHERWSHVLAAASVSTQEDEE